MTPIKGGTVSLIDGTQLITWGKMVKNGPEAGYVKHVEKRQRVFFSNKTFLGGGFKYCLFSPRFGEIVKFDSYFSNGLKAPTSFVSFGW